jgi:predicted trehalose synthase
MLGAKTALKMISRYSSGIEPQISMKRWNSRSTLPPKNPWIAPVTTPSTTPVKVSASANSTLTRKP